MSYESDSALVQEIVDFAERGPLLRPAAPIEEEGLHIVYDFAEARDYAYRRYLTEADDAWNWTDLREHEAGEMDHASNGTIRKALDWLWDPVLAALQERLPPRYGRILDDVLADLVNAASSRAVFGADDRLFDKVWDAYRGGGWPCGWEGNYPEGRLVVYQPDLAT